MTCSEQLKRTVPLHKVVSASIIDVYEDIGKTQQVFSHWAARGLRKLQAESLKSGKKPVLLTVNGNTRTATLPPDFDFELFVGIINSCGDKVPLKLRPNITNTKYIEEIPCGDKCDKCNQDRTICEDLQVTEIVTLAVIDDTTYPITTIKKLYPDGGYYLETSTPVKNIETNAVEYVVTKEFIAALALKECGCLETTAENLALIRRVCPDTYCCYYASCDNSCSVDYGGYRIFGESGLIQFDSPHVTQAYLEYVGFMTKKNGQYQVPEVAFETLVEWTKAMSLDGKRSVPIRERQYRWQQYGNARSNMEKMLGRVSLSQIMHSISVTPKFDVSAPDSWYNCYSRTAAAAAAAAAETSAVVPVQSPPPLAPSLAITAVAGDAEVLLTWLAIASATGYVLQRSLHANFAEAVTIYTGALLTYNNTGLTNGTKYYYRVKGTAAGFADSPYATTSATPTTGLITLATPELSLSVISSTQINASWLAVPNRTNYFLQRATNAGFTANLTTLYSSTGLAFNNTGLIASTQYFYRIKAVGDGVTYSDSGYDVANATTQAGVTTFTADWGWTLADPYVNNSTIPTIASYQGTGSFTLNGPITTDFHTMPTQYFGILREPSTEPVKTIWSDSGSVFNNGIIPDSVFRAAFVVGGYRYYVTRVPMDFDTQVGSRVEFS